MHYPMLPRSQRYAGSPLLPLVAVNYPLHSYALGIATRAVHCSRWSQCTARSAHSQLGSLRGTVHCSRWSQCTAHSARSQL